MPRLGLRHALAALALAGTAVTAAPASAACGHEYNPCVTACDKAAAAYESVIRKFGIPLPGFPVDCPQT